MTKVAIVGAGPAGLFAAHELAQHGFEVVVVDMGKDVSQRSRSDPFDLLHGMGGSGTFSDGKINFHAQVGGDLYQFLRIDEAWQLVGHIEQVFARYDVRVIATDDERTRDLEKRAANCGVRFLPIRQAHVGSDHLTALIHAFGEDLARQGVTFRLETRVEDVICGEGRVRGLMLADGTFLEADAVIGERLGAARGAAAGSTYLAQSRRHWRARRGARHCHGRCDCRELRPQVLHARSHL